MILINSGAPRSVLIDDVNGLIYQEIQCLVSNATET